MQLNMFAVEQSKSRDDTYACVSTAAAPPCVFTQGSGFDTLLTGVSFLSNEDKGLG